MMDEYPYNIKPWVNLIAGLVVVLGLYIIVSSIIASQATGVLVAKTQKPDATISISQANKQAVAIGTGTAKVRLAPGVYQVAAANAGFRTVEIVTVSKKHTTSVSLNLNKTSVIKSAANINFQNMNSLVNQGLSTDQISEMEQYFFQFKSSATRVAVDASSVQNGPTDPSVPTFSVNFNVAMDSVPYKATVTYSNSDSIHMYLYNTQGGQVFDSATIPTQIGGD